MRNHDLPGVQGLTPKLEPNLALAFIEASGRAPTTVAWITNNGVSDISHVNANLMGAAGFEFHFQQGRSGQMTGHPVVRDCRSSIAPHDLTSAIDRMAAQGLLNATAGDNPPPDQRLIRALDPPALHGRNQKAMGIERAGDQQTATGVLVQAMDQTRPGQTFQAPIKMQQCVDQRALGMAGAGVHDQTRRLVDNQQLLLLDQNLQVNGLRTRVAWVRLQGCLKQHLLATADRLTRLGGLPVKEDPALSNPTGDAAARIVGPALGQYLIKPAAIVAVGYEQTVSNRFIHAHAALGWCSPRIPATARLSVMNPNLLSPPVRASVVLMLTVIMLAVSGCNREEREETRGPEELYAEAKSSLDAHNYATAIRQYRRLTTLYPFGRHTEQAQLDLGYAFHRAGEPEEALRVLDRFIRTFPTHPNVDYAWYLKGLVHYEEAMGMLRKLLPGQVVDRDQESARRSFLDFQELIQRYPTSRYVADARQRMVFLRNVLAEYEITVGEYYFRRKAYIAAINRAQFIIQNYPGAPANINALELMVRSFGELGLTGLAADTDRILEYNFADVRDASQQRDKRGFFSRLWPFN